MTPQDLEQAMRSLRAAALARPPPRVLDTHSPAMETTRLLSRKEEPTKHDELRKKTGSRMPLNISQAERNRIAKIFASHV